MQILVVVANIQKRTLKTEGETVSMKTSFDHGLDDPKSINLLKCLKGKNVNIHFPKIVG